MIQCWTHQKKKNPNVAFGRFLFFFGCRQQSKDYLYGEEMEALHADGLLDLYVPAFSRDQAHKVYVQHRIREMKERVWRLLTVPNTYVFVSGSSVKMPEDVRNAFLWVCKEEGHMDDAAAESFLRKLELTCRYVTETWS